MKYTEQVNPERQKGLQPVRGQEEEGMWGNCFMSTWLHYVMMNTSNQTNVVVTQHSEYTATEIVHFQMLMLYEFHRD